MKHHRILPIAAGVFFLSLPSTFFAQQKPQNDIPRIISYQGILTSSDGKAITDGTHSIQVTLYADPAGNEVIWQDTYDVATLNGVFNLLIGNGQSPLPSTTLMSRLLWVGTRVNGQDEMRPLTPLTASPYALTLPNQAITTEKIADGAITPEKLSFSYLSKLKVNGEDANNQGTVLNITSGDGIELNYEESTQTLQIARSNSNLANSDEEKSTSILTPNSGDYWSEAGNHSTNPANDYVGTSDNVAFHLRTNNTHAMHFQPHGSDTPDIVGGSANNTITNSLGSVIAGGGSPTQPNSIDNNYSFIGGGLANKIEDENDYSAIVSGRTNHIYEGTISVEERGSNFIGGGNLNNISSTTSSGVGESAIVGGGNHNLLSSLGFIGGGEWNRIETGAIASTIGGGSHNTASAYYATVGGGFYNEAVGGTSGKAAVVGGGGKNKASGLSSTVAGGLENLASGEGAFIGGGGSDYIHAVGIYTSVASGDFSAIVGGFTQTVSGDYSFIGGGDNIIVEGDWSSIAGGDENKINDAGSNYGVIGGGQNNEIGAASSPAQWSTIGGGYSNTVTADYSVLGGGDGNSIESESSGIVGGDANHILNTGSTHGVIGGGEGNTIGGAESNAPHSAIVGGFINDITTDFSFIGGGYSNTITSSSTRAVIAGGQANSISGPLSYIGGGYFNQIESHRAVIGGGSNNKISNSFSDYSTISGGIGNIIGSVPVFASYSTISGGSANNTQDLYGAIGGGSNNSIMNGGQYATIPGGRGLQTKSFGQTVLGFYNLPQGTISGGITPVVTQTDAFNDRLFMIGNGVPAARHNAFEVSYNGHSIVYDKNGSGTTRAAIRGATYMDNVIYAWGSVDVAFGQVNVNCDFGVANVIRKAPGIYTVTLNLREPDGSAMNIDCGSVTANIVYKPQLDPPNFPTCAVIQTTPITGDTFDIYILDFSCHSVDANFTFKVAGRPSSN